MKKLLVLLVLLFAAPAWSAPFLVCDPQAGVVGYTLEGLTTDTRAAQTDGSLKYDLEGLPNGNYTVKVVAYNVEGWPSAATNFTFTKSSPPAPAGVKIVPK